MSPSGTSLLRGVRPRIPKSLAFLWIMWHPVDMAAPEPRARAIPLWTLGDRLRKAREQAGLRQDDLAAILGLSSATISNYEKGLRHPRGGELALIERWAEETCVDRDWLLGAHNPGYESRATHLQLVPSPYGQMHFHFPNGDTHGLTSVP
jgi:DNA-binding XRE family transcriptional regulator